MSSIKPTLDASGEALLILLGFFERVRFGMRGEPLIAVLGPFTTQISGDGVCHAESDEITSAGLLPMRKVVRRFLYVGQTVQEQGRVHEECSAGRGSS
jgi:hypothetical protein